MYGGTRKYGAVQTFSGGLSPRVRGNRIDCPAHIPFRGSIPACTGEPVVGEFVHQEHKVYPRVYGGTCRVVPSRRVSTGLSPRVRGNRFLQRGRQRRQGSIPACTGEPRAIHNGGECNEVYPRVYGGTIRIPPLDPNIHGLSPRVRGNPVYIAKEMTKGGSIPACTGEPRSMSLSARVGRVYPRVYGGTTLCRRFRRSTCGLSPRVRGNPTWTIARVAVLRSIPACTGEPDGQR